MQRFWEGLFLTLGLLAAGTTGLAAPYVWLTADTTPLRADSLASPFADGDIVYGHIRANGPIRISGSPVFWGQISTAADSLIRGPGFNPQFNDLPPQFGMNHFTLPTTAENLRICGSGNWFDSQNGAITHRAKFDGAVCRMYAWPTGAPFDSSHVTSLPLTNRTAIFVDGPLEVLGSVRGNVTLGCSGTMRLIDDVRYVDANPVNGRIPEDSQNFLGLVSEADIKIANTLANGRENSGGQGHDAPRDRSSIVITAFIAALGGSFTFEQQNDPDSGYVCECIPDERGTIYICGMVLQQRMGYLSRSNNQFTGYRLHLLDDTRLYQTRPPCSFDERQDSVTAELDFGEVPLGSTVTDTVCIYSWGVEYYDSAFAGLPFSAPPVELGRGQYFAIPVSFTPTEAGMYQGWLAIRSWWHTAPFIPLRGVGIDTTTSGTHASTVLSPLSFSLSSAPNPFNSTTTLRLDLPRSGPVRLTVRDILGREVATLLNETLPAGAHTLRWDAAAESSGLYIIHAQTPAGSATHKLLLIK